MTTARDRLFSDMYVSAATPTPTPASAPMYPTLPPLPPLYTAPDPLYHEKVAYNKALELGTKVIETAARALFDLYLKHIETGAGKEAEISPDDDLEDSAPLRRNVMAAFKTLLERIDPTVQVVVGDDKSCRVKFRDLPDPAKPQQDDCQKALVRLLNDQLLRLQVGSKIWLRTEYNNKKEYKLAILTKFTIDKESYSGQGAATYIDTGKEADFFWGAGYSFPLIDTSAVFLPCWNETESFQQLKQFFALTPSLTSSSPLKVDDCICVEDCDQKVYVSLVVDCTATQVKVHYYGWGTQCDEWVDRTSDRIKRKLDVSKVILVGDPRLSAKMRRFLKAFGSWAVDESYEKIFFCLKTLTSHSINSCLLDSSRPAPLRQTFKQSSPFAVLTFGSRHLTLYCMENSKAPPDCEWQIK